MSPLATTDGPAAAAAAAALWCCHRATDDGSLRRLFRSLEGKLSNGKKPSIFPWKVCLSF
jgi:hypothetical protein